MIEKFEDRRLFGNVAVTCKFEDGTVRKWIDRKENIVANIVRIVNAYDAKGLKLTLRQLHYQFVGHVPGYVNHDSAYKKLGRILDDCRYGGAIDWDAIEDRGRRPYLPYWAEDVADALRDTLSSYRVDRQNNQETHLELWTEKDALSGIFSVPCSQYHIRLVVNKGYTSSSALYGAYERLAEVLNSGRRVVILYFGDHDPSGLDMIRDIDERLRFMFENGRQLSDNWDLDNFEVRPIGLNMSQVRKYKLPPNPTKMTDSRADKYVAEFGQTCWEVDALDPDVLVNLVVQGFKFEIDQEIFDEQLEREAKDKKVLAKLIKDHSN